MDTDVRINGERYIPISQVPLRMQSGKQPSDVCRVCGEENYRTTNSRSRDGYRSRTKECLNCGHRWNTIEYAVLPVGRPKTNLKP